MQNVWISFAFNFKYKPSDFVCPHERSYVEKIYEYLGAVLIYSQINTCSAVLKFVLMGSYIPVLIRRNKINLVSNAKIIETNCS
jgi:hypothetical protein